MPGFKKPKTEEEYARVASKTDRALTDARGELRGLCRHLGRRFARAPVPQYAKEYVDEAVKEQEDIVKKAQGAWNRYA